MKMRLRSIIALMLALLLAVPAFGAGADEAGNSELEPMLELVLGDRPVKTEPTHITVGNTTKVSGSFFTAQFGNNTSDLDVRNMLHGYDPVYWSTQEAFEPDPMVVESLDVTQSGGNTVYTVHLYDDLTYNDGQTPVTAEDYVFSFLMLCSDEFSGLGAKPGEWGHLVGYEEYVSGQSDRLAGLHLIDDYTFSVTVKQPYEPFFYELTYISVYPYPIGVIAPGCKVADSREGAYITNIDDTVAEPLYTTELLVSTILGDDGYLHKPYLTCGPYRLVSYDMATGVVEFEINEFYKGNWDGVTPYIDTVTLVEAKIDTMIDDLASGKIGLLNKCVDGKVINDGNAICSDGMFQRSNYPRLGYGFLAVACEQGPQQFQAVRQAIACCLDTDTFVQQFLQGYGLTVDGYYGIGQWMYYAANGLNIPKDLEPDVQALWEAVTLENLDHYTYDTERALQLLIDDGWVLNEKGEEFNPDTDDIRYKKLDDGSLMRLSFNFAQCADNDGAQRVVDMLTMAFADINAELVVNVVPFTALLADYYREDGRAFDLNFMATNFVSVFDPYLHFVKDDRFEGSMNTSGIDDAELLKLAWDMHETEPFNELEFLQEWQLFQERFNEILPTIPIYSNIYFDFYTYALRNYNPGSEYDWPVALLYSWIDETPLNEETDVFGMDEFEDEESENEEVIFID